MSEQLYVRGENGHGEGSRPMHDPEVGDHYHHDGGARRVRAVADETVTLTERWHKKDPLWEYDLDRDEFERLVEAGELVHHPPCGYCGLPYDPDDDPGTPTDEPVRPADEALHYQCWYENASVAERVAAEAERTTGYDMANEALRAVFKSEAGVDEDDGDQRHRMKKSRSQEIEAFLLGVLGDPARSLFDREEAELLLSGAVETRTLIDAQAECPDCLERESWPMDPETGEVRCHCGTLMKEGEA